MAEVIPFRSTRGRQRKLRLRPFPALRRYRWILAAVVVFAIPGFVIGRWQESSGPKFTDFATTVDGDTIRIRNQRIRLMGMDAPEIHQTCRDAFGRDWSCGVAARDRLAALISAAIVRCSPSGHDRYGRVLAVCTSSAGEDLGGTLVHEGLAVAYGDYKLAELNARLANRGVWSGSFERPWLWRKAHKH